MNQQVVYQDISQIHPYENNPRNNEAAIEPVAQSIKRFGFRVPILIDGKGTIIAGHTRYEPQTAWHGQSAVYSGR